MKKTSLFALWALPFCITALALLVGCQGERVNADAEQTETPIVEEKLVDYDPIPPFGLTKEITTAKDAAALIPYNVTMEDGVYGIGYEARSNTFSASELGVNFEGACASVEYNGIAENRVSWVTVVFSFKNSEDAKEAISLLHQCIVDKYGDAASEDIYIPEYLWGQDLDIPDIRCKLYEDTFVKIEYCLSEF